MAGVEIDESRRQKRRDETAFRGDFQSLEDCLRQFSRRWKTRQRPRRDKLRRSAGAKRRTKQAVRSSRPDGLRSSLGWLLPQPAACLSVSGARQSAASSSSRAPPKTKTRRRAERTGRRQPPRRWPPATGSQPRPDVQEGRPATAPTRATEAERAASERSTTGAAQRRPCSEPRPAARSRSTARRAWGRGVSATS